jgi:hypothetical protein
MGETTAGGASQPSDSSKPGIFKRIFHHPNFNVMAGLFGIAVFAFCWQHVFNTIKFAIFINYAASK